ncbi:TonB-dependent receptor domain-containing protein [Empedobacter stercoris]|uniref:TonB-dependent receptor domain-containing protein n=1 Tax=Empedobacter stercoris TaxID=1628248 RepID=UPI0039EB3B91
MKTNNFAINKHELSIAMKRNLTLLLLLGSAALFAQTNIKLEGTLFDQRTNQPLSGKSFTVEGLDIQAKTDENGRYEISVPDDTYQLEMKVDGYQTITQNLTDSNTLNMYLQPEDFKDGKIDLSTAVITGVRSKAAEANLLNLQKRSVNMVTNIGSAELERKGVSDAATAMTKIAGISKLDGTNSIFVRGLGDRYISTTLNNLPLPSNDPEYKNIDLSLFNTDIIEYISVDKVYSPKLLGDFSGAAVDIVSKDFQDKGLFQIYVGTSVNTNAIGESNFMLQDGPSKTGFSKINVPNNPLNSYQFKTKLNPTTSSTIAPNFGLKAGKTFRIGDEGKLGVFASASFNSNYDYREGINQTVNALGGLGGRLRSFVPHQKYSYETNSTGMFNANYKINKNHSIKYNFLFINSSEQSRDLYYGFIRDIAEDDNGLIQRNTYIQNQLMVNQLLGDHKLTDKLDLNWGLAFNKIESDVPDRTQNTLRLNKTTNEYQLAQNSTTDNHRYFHNLIEKSYAANVGLSYRLNKSANGLARGFVKVGYNGRFVNRDFEARQFNFRLNNSQVVDPNNLDAFFNETNYNNGYFSTTTYSGTLAPQVYNGDQTIHAGYANLEYNLTDKLSAVLGLRYENILQEISWRTQLSSDLNSNMLDENYFLPSLIVKYAINNKQNLRFGASKTYTLPQFKEKALFLYEDVNETKYGNPFLYASDNYNVDLKWEIFPSHGELISIAGFGKYIQNPINEVVIASSTNDISWVNGDYGYVVGAELEIRKNIFNFGQEGKNTLSAGLNASYMKTDQEIDAEKVRKETKGMYNLNLTTPKAALTGASDFLLNADVSYVKSWKRGSEVMATLSYAYYSDRIYALNNENRGNLIDKGIGSLDFILRTKLNKNIGINIAARNILNPEFKRVQENETGNVTAVSYKRGANFGLSVNYNF